MKTIKSGIPSYYRPDQVRAYLQRIGFPGVDDNDTPVANLANLALLVKLHFLAFPFENSRLHYTADHDVDVRTDFIYKRLVEDRQGGSWCFGQNGLFLGILRGLGYRAYAAPARVKMSPPMSTEGGYSLLLHLIILVQLDSDSPDPTPNDPTTYLIDVGFGGSGLARPILLEEGHTVPGTAPPEEHRVVRVMFPDSSLEESESAREWALQVRCGSYQRDWTILFIFYEFEFYPDDWIATSQWLSQHPVALMRDNVIAIRHFAVDSGGNAGEVSSETDLGRLVMIGKRVDRRIGDQSEHVKEFSTEAERIRILRDDFGITVGEDEVSNIHGTAPALPMQ